MAILENITNNVREKKLPSGPPELHEFWSNYNQEQYADTNAQEYLRSQGYHLTDGWEWVRPSPTHEPTELEYSAIDYLIMEWDWGGICDYSSELTLRF